MWRGGGWCDGCATNQSINSNVIYSPIGSCWIAQSDELDFDFRGPEISFSENLSFAVPIQSFILYRHFLWGGCGQTIQHVFFFFAGGKKANECREESGPCRVSYFCWDTPQPTKNWVDFFCQVHVLKCIAYWWGGHKKSSPKTQGKELARKF